MTKAALLKESWVLVDIRSQLGMGLGFSFVIIGEGPGCILSYTWAFVQGPQLLCLAEEICFRQLCGTN